MLDLDDLREGVRTDAGFLVVIDVHFVGKMPETSGEDRSGRIGGRLESQRRHVVGVDADLVDVVLLVGMGSARVAILGVGDLHGDRQGVIVETAVNLESDIFASEIVIPHVAEEVSDQNALLVERVGVVDVADPGGKPVPALQP